MIALVRSVANRIACACVLAACAGSPRSPDTIVIASGTDLEGMQPMVTVHPLSRQVQRYLVFTPLVRLSATLQPEPWAASAWMWNADRTALTFVLDTALRWHDGAPVTGDDVQFTLDLARDEATGYARRGDLTVIADVTVLAPDRVALRFSSAQAGVPLVLAELPLLPRHTLRNVPASALRRHAFTFAPVGSGPYRVVQRDAGQRWILERVGTFPARMGGVAATKTLVIAVVDEATTKVAGLVSGALDMAGVNPATATLVQRDPTLRVLDYPTFFTNWLVFNPTCDAVHDVRVRQAIAIAIDRQRIVQAGVGGFGVPSSAPAADLARDTTAPSPARADSLLDAAGWRRSGSAFRSRSGRTLTLPMLSVGSGDNPVEQLLQSDLRARGIDLRIATRDYGALLSAARAGGADHCAIYTGVAGDPARSQLSALFDPAAAGGALDFGARRPADLAPLFARMRTSTDSGARNSAWR
ncbi:MAG TPA: ABC transporter substrate-binding protein, partial [Gemmatimonadaceae bacterium]|nr:ABC transporter substrate-binding protein [Gemmatimonadaceae bacterium]